jgi:hypothetical protein
VSAGTITCDFFFLHFVDCVPRHVSYKRLDCIEVRILLAHSVEYSQ